MQTKMSSRHWMIIIGAFCLSASVAFITTAFSFFVVPVTTALSFERGAFMIYFSLMMLVGMFFLPVWAKAISKIGVKKVVLLSGCGVALGVVAFSFCKTLIAFYAVGIWMGITFQGCTVLPAIVLVNTWFMTKKD